MISPGLTLNTDPRAAAQPGDAALFRRDGNGDDRSERASFASVLGKAQKGSHETIEQYSRRTAESFVAIGLVQPVLQKLRETNNAAPPFAPTDGEKQFRSLADAALAQEIVASKNFPLVDHIAKKLIEKARSRTGGTDASADSGSGLPAIPWSTS